MAGTLVKAGHETVSQVKDLLDRYYPELKEVQITFNLLFAHAPEAPDGKEKKPAVMLHGYPCAATIKVNSYEQRVKGTADATITLDGDRWPDWSPQEQVAILDHQIQHIELKRDQDGQVVADDCGRPKMRLKPHDWNTGGFEIVVKRHGDAAAERIEAKLVADKYGQLLFPWG